jgi:hypothetical protein
MKVKILLLAAALLFQAAAATAQEAGNAQDVAAIRQLVQYYFEGWKNDDAESLKKAFHPKAKFYGISDDNGLKETSQSQVYAALKENIRRGTPKVDASLKIISIDAVGTAASVKIEIEYTGEYQSARSTEFLSLIKFPKDGWKVVSKVSAIEQRPPASK